MPSKRALPPVEYCPWEQAQARRQTHRLSGKRPVADRRDNGRGYNRPYLGNLLYAAAAGIGISDALQFITEHPDLLLDHLPLVPEQFQKVTHLGVRSFSSF